MSSTYRPDGANQATVDGRLAARRSEIARLDLRRRRRRVAVIAVVVVLAVAAGLALRSRLFDVDAVVVTGTRRTGEDLARRTAGIDHRRAMVSVDPGAAEARLERLPWVAEAHVGRRWPGTVTVHVVERKPLVVIEVPAGAASVDPPGLLAVDRTGQALGPVEPGSGDAVLPVLSGPLIAVGHPLEPLRRRVVATVAALPAELRREVVDVHAGRGGATLVLAEGVTVRWGDGRRTRAKGEALRTILRQPGRQAIATIDVTVPSAAAVTGKTGWDR